MNNIEPNAKRMINKWNKMQSSPWIFFKEIPSYNSTREDNSNNHIFFFSTNKCINFDNKSNIGCFKSIQKCNSAAKYRSPFDISHSQNKMTALCKDKID